MPDFAGSYAKKPKGENWKQWPDAKVGKIVRVARFTGETVQSNPRSRFGETMAPQTPLKGFARMEWLGASTIVKVDAKGQVKYDRPLPAGDIAFLGDAFDAYSELPLRLAGSPGTAFARVLQDAQNNINVPSFRAIDIRNDNRIPPKGEWTSKHRFELTCASPRIRATLLYRSFPPSWVEQRQWDRPDLFVLEQELQLPGGFLSTTTRQEP